MTRRRWRDRFRGERGFLAGAGPFLNLRLTHYVESVEFPRVRLDDM